MNPPNPSSKEKDTPSHPLQLPPASEVQESSNQDWLIKIQKLLQEILICRIFIKNGEGQTLMEVPLGVAFALAIFGVTVFPLVAAVAVIGGLATLLVTPLTIAVEPSLFSSQAIRTMRRDLKELYLSPSEVENLTQLRVRWLYRPRSIRGPWAGFRRWAAFWDPLRLLIVLDLICRLFVWKGSLLTLVGRMVIPGLRSDSWQALAVEWGIFVVLAAIHQIVWMIRSWRMPLLLHLLEEVDRYNNLIHAIRINDELEEAGNKGVQLSQRKQVIEALKLTRADLVRALKTERILRQNQALIDSHQEDLFVNNLAGLTALQVSEKAGEQGRLLDIALQIALDVRAQMQNLREQASSQDQKEHPDPQEQDWEGA